jgi:hypothetical protein
LEDLRLPNQGYPMSGVIISKQLLGTHYQHHDGQVIDQPIERFLKPSFEALKEHLNWSGILAGRTTITRT